MDKIITFIKILALYQIGLLLLLLLLFFIMRLVLSYQGKKKIDVRKRIVSLLDDALQNKTLLASEQLKQLKPNMFELLFLLAEQKEQYAAKDFFPDLEQQLSTALFKLEARRLISSKKWFKRYIAIQAYSHGYDKEDEDRLLRLIKDKSLLVSLNAAAILLINPNEKIINAIIDNFSEQRRIQQSSCADLLKNTKIDLSPIIEARIAKETNPYIKIFCYRLLSQIGNQQKIGDRAKQDLTLDSIDLKIAILYYIHRSQDSAKEELILSLVEDPHWEVRATIAKLLGSYHNHKTASILEALLHDKEHWVCVNAAQALVHHDRDGIAILHNQKPELNAKAFDIAQNVIRHMERNSSVHSKE